MRDTLRTMQPFVEYNWNILDSLSLDVGFKYQNFRRDLNATINQKTELPLEYAQTWVKFLPSVALHWQLTDQWTAYAQWAKGFLAPNLNLLYTTGPQGNTFQPEGSNNKQIGTTWTGDRLTVSGDLYYIDFTNFIQTHKVAGVQIAYNDGDVVYKGIEAEGTYMLGAGISVYANATLNSAIQSTTGLWIDNAPHKTAALGLIYRDGPWQASLIDKFVGHQYYGLGSTTQTTPLGGFAILNAAVNYTLPLQFEDVHDIKLALHLNNLLNNRSIFDIPGSTAAGDPLYYTIPERSFQFTVSAKLF
jgi:iron complex outermembrane receptor protein